MVVSKTAQTRHKTSKRPPNYYKNLRRELAAKGRTAPKHADKHQEKQKITSQEVEQVRHIQLSPVPIYDRD